MKKNNVVDLGEFRRKKGGQKGTKPTDPSKSEMDASVVSMDERRKEEIASERRQLTRTVLSHFVGVFVVLPEKGLQPVSLYDVSEGGLAFDVPMELGKFEIGEPVTMRMYLSHDTYFAFTVRVANVRDVSGAGTYRHGTIMKKTEDSFQTLYFFMKFLEEVGKVARKDHGERVIGRMD